MVTIPVPVVAVVKAMSTLARWWCRGPQKRNILLALSKVITDWASTREKDSKAISARLQVTVLLAIVRDHGQADRRDPESLPAVRTW